MVIFIVWILIETHFRHGSGLRPMESPSFGYQIIRYVYLVLDLGLHLGTKNKIGENLKKIRLFNNFI